MKRLIVVTGCGNCPWYRVDPEVIQARCEAANRGGPFAGLPLSTSGSAQGWDDTPPKWCPLRRGRKGAIEMKNCRVQLEVRSE